MLTVNLLVLPLIAAANPEAAEKPAPTPAQVRQAVARSLPYLEKSSVTWMSEKKCVSCHQVSFMLWPHQEAQNRGLAVDAGKLTEWTDWSVNFCVENKTDKGVRNGGGLETMVQMILSRPADAKLDKYRDLAGLIAGMQKSDGSWPAGGQLPGQKRPKPETDAVSTMWTLLALSSLEELPEAAAKSRTQALAWLKIAKPGESTEWVAVRLLLAHRLGEKADSATWLKELRARQNADGGWSWSKDHPSDALSTGQALYALAIAGGASGQTSAARAWKFLIDTQGGDGAWQIPSTLAAKKDKAYAVSNHYGTGWATLGLVQSLPK